MRKKSHLSLAGFLVQGMDNEVLSRRWRSFYLGNILPDCKPSFVTVRHEYDKTFDLMAEMLRALAEEDGYWSMDTAQYMRDLGQIFHYIADYFTYPHNKIYPGSLKDHCSYEEKLKRDLRKYIRTDAAKPHKADHLEFKNAKNLCDFIQKSHDDYLVRKHDVEDDIHHIVEVNYKAMETMIHLLAEKRAEFRLKHS